MLVNLGSILARSLLTIVITVTFVFVILRVSGDPMYGLVPVETPTEVVEMLRKKWGLDQPLYVQYFQYMANLLQGDFGRSMENGRPALDLVLERAPATLRLMGASMLIAILVGVTAGVAAAIWRGTLVDRIVMVMAVIVHSIPGFVLAILLILLFAVALRLLPSGGGSSLLHMILPATVIGMSGAGVIARFTRSSTLEVLGQRFVLAARSRRLGSFVVAFRHVLPNAALPLLTLLGFMLGGLIGGAAIVESVFAWPGIGQSLVAAVGKRDLALVQAIVILITVGMVAANLVIDVLYVLVDPRMRQGKATAN